MAAGFIEPRLASLSPQEADQRRSIIGIITGAGSDGIRRDWIFVDVTSLPIETPSGRLELKFAGIAAEHLLPGTYSERNGLFAVNAKGIIYLSANKFLNADDSRVLADSQSVLEERQFHDSHQGQKVPFHSSSGRAIRAALLNACAPGLATSFDPGLPDASGYAFFNDTFGEVFAAIPPLQPNRHIGGVQL